jgi:DNA polymerase-3 subunit delta'
MLSDEAGNALLKILEEPHEGTMLILTTAHPTQLLPTIVSRCQQIQFDPASAGEIAGALAGREHLPPEDAALIAELSAGSYGRAIELNGPAVADRRNDAVAFLRAALYKTNRELLDEIDRLQSAYERAGIIELLAILESWLRDAHFIAEGAAAMQSGLDRQTVEKFAAHHTVVSYDRVFDALASAISLLGKNVYISLVLITLALDLRKAIHPANL